MKCEICGKEYGTKQALNSHLGWHNKPNRTSNFVEYSKKLKNGEVTKISSNQYVKAKNEGRVVEMSKSAREKIGNASRAAHKLRWTEDGRKRQSDSMKKAVRDNPESYSISNVSGRVKSYDYKDSNGNNVKLKGTWELSVAEFLNKKNIKWTNIIEPFPYYWNDGWHLYFPDFYLYEYDIYIEVKGFERERDRCKWECLGEKLIKIKSAEMKNLEAWYDKNISCLQNKRLQ
jgi:ribosomal protein L24E